MAGPLDSIMKVILPRRQKPGGTSQTNSFEPDNRDQTLSAPDYRNHLKNIFETRQSENSQLLLKELFIHDPDVSAAVNAFLTTADTDPIFVVRDVDGAIDRQGMQDLNKIISVLTSRFDYSKGFQWKQSIKTLSESMRYMLLLRGGIAEELVFDKNQAAVELRHVDLASILWYEKESNWFVPEQTGPQSSEKISLDVPTFFVSFFRKDPTSIYSFSPFVSAINTVAARQQVINDLYRIMQLTGFPRIEATIMEEVLLKNAPAAIQQDGAKQRAYVDQELARIQAFLSNTRADQSLIHTDAVQMKMFNDKNPSNALNIDSIIGALNAMNQAGLRVVATVLGRGESGVNTASVEARIFSMNAEALNEPIAEMWSKVLTMALRVATATESRVECKFRPVELRPHTELEPQLTMRAARLKEDLSLGIIDDDEYHMEMYGRIRPDSAPELSGTGFMKQTAIGVDEEKVTPNDDPMGRSLSPKGSKSVRGDDIKKGSK